MEQKADCMEAYTDCQLEGLSSPGKKNHGQSWANNNMKSIYGIYCVAGNPITLPNVHRSPFVIDRNLIISLYTQPSTDFFLIGRRTQSRRQAEDGSILQAYNLAGKGGINNKSCPPVLYI